MTTPFSQVALISDVASPCCETVRRALAGLVRLEVMSLDAAESLSERLVSAEVDLVLADLQRGWDPALEVLRRVKAVRPDVPVLLVGVDAGVAMAVEAMRAGFEDCVALHGLDVDRLPQAIRQAIERSRSDSHATRRTSPLETILQRLRVGFFRLSPDGILSRANRACLDLLGFPSLAEARRVPLHERLLTPEMASRISTTLRRAGRVPISEAIFRRPDGGLANLWLSETLGTTLGGESVIDGIVFEPAAQRSDAVPVSQAARAHVALHSLPVLLFILDRFGSIVWMQGPERDRPEIDMKTCIGSPFTTICPTLPDLRQCIDQALKGEVWTTMEIGSRRYDVRLAPMLGARSMSPEVAGMAIPVNRPGVQPSDVLEMKKESLPHPDQVTRRLDVAADVPA